MEIAVTAGPKLDGGDLLHVGELPLCRLSHGCQSIRRRLVVPVLQQQIKELGVVPSS